MKNLSRLIFSLFCVIGLMGCAAVVPKNEVPDPDPFQYTNRQLYTLHKHLDDYFFKPVAKGYQATLPAPVRKGVSNVFANLVEVTTTVNDLLQGKPRLAGNDLSRLVINSTVGILGIFEPSQYLGLTRRVNTFGETLEFYGAKSSPFLFIPVIGPTTIRDFAGDLVDTELNPFMWQANSNEKLIYGALYGIQLRASILKSESVANHLIFDEYIFVRNAYLQRRGMEIQDNVNSQDSDDLLFTDEFE